MRIPSFCGLAEFRRSLTYNRQKIDEVLRRFDAGRFDKADLETLTMAARRTAFVCNELVKWQHVKMLVESEAQKDELDGFSWE